MGEKIRKETDQTVRLLLERTVEGQYWEEYEKRVPTYMTGWYVNYTVTAFLRIT